jgi:hypothetical protein
MYQNNCSDYICTSQLGGSRYDSSYGLRLIPRIFPLLICSVKYYMSILQQATTYS